MKDYLTSFNEDMLFADGFDDALVGYIEGSNSQTIACYNKEKCIEILMKKGYSMGSFEAEEYFYHKVLGANFGENTPCFLTIINGGTK